jgi:hypothetical protein
MFRVTQLRSDSRWAIPVGKLGEHGSICASGFLSGLFVVYGQTLAAVISRNIDSLNVLMLLNKNSGTHPGMIGTRCWNSFA